MGAAPLLLALAVVTADAGWENDGRGGYRYIIQVPMEQWESVRTEGSITSQIPANLQGQVSSVEIRIGDGPIPKAIIADSRTSSNYPAPPDTITTLRAQDNGGFQVPPLDSLGQQGSQAIDDLKNAAADKFREIQQQTSNQFSDAATKAVDDTINNVRNAVDSRFNAQSTPGASSAGPSVRGQTTAPALQPSTSAQPSTSSFAAQSGGPSTAPNTGGNSNFTSPFGPAGPAPRTTAGGPSTRPTGSSTGFPAVDAANSGTSSAWPTAANNPASSQSNNPATTPQFNTDPYATTSTPTDPPSMIRGEEKYEPDLVRLERVQGEFQYRDDILSVDDKVLYVLKLERQIVLDKEGYMVDRITGAKLREDDPRLGAVLRFRDAYSEFYQEQQAKAYRDQLANSRNTGSSRLASLPSNGFGPTTNSSPPFTNPGAGWNTSPTYNQSQNSGQYEDRALLTEREEIARERQRLKEKEEYADMKIRMAQLQENSGLQPPDNTTSLGDSGQPNRVGTTNTNVQRPGGLAGNGSASDKLEDDEEGKAGKATKKAESPPFFNFLLLISVLANIYMGMQISRLLQRYRNLVASQRGTQLVT